MMVAAAMFLSGCQRPAANAPRPAPPNVAVTAQVADVLDGDTIVVRVDGRTETVRLLGIDTPESPGGPRPAECFGAEASAFAARLLPIDTAVTLTRDVETRDVYGRLLAFVHRQSDGLFVNLTMLETGHASPLFIAPNGAMEADFNAAADGARRDWIGFWPACGAVDVTLSPDDLDP